MNAVKTGFTFLVVVSCALATACGSAVGGSTCDRQGRCSQGRVCHVATNLCVGSGERGGAAPNGTGALRDAGVSSAGILLFIQSPASTDALDGGTTTLAGTVTSDAGIVALDYRVDGDAGSWAALAASTRNSFSAVVPLPARDSGPMLFEVRATDGQQNQRVAQVSPQVDNVAPTASFTAPNGSRDIPPQLQLVFSEPVTLRPGTVIASLTPDAGLGVWDSTSNTLTFRGLASDTRYIANFDSSGVTDAFGNVGNGSGAISVWTQPAIPVNGTKIDLGNVEAVFDAAADVDGVVTLAWAAPSAFGGQEFDLTAGTFESHTGTFTTFSTSAASLPFPDLNAFAGEAVNGAGVVVRSAGIMSFVDSGSRTSRFAQYSVAGVASSQMSSPFSLLAIPKPCAAPTNPMAYLGPGPGSAASTATWPGGNLIFGLLPRWVTAQGPNDFELLAYDGLSVSRQRVTSDCAAARQTVNHPIETNYLPGIATTPNLSIATTTTGVRLYVYDTSAAPQGRTEACVGCTAGTTCTPIAIHHPPGELLHVASANQGALVLGARLNTDSSYVELLTQDLSQCTRGWQTLATVTDVTGVTQFRPVMFGNHPGLVLQQGTQLRVFYVTP